MTCGTNQPVKHYERNKEREKQTQGDKREREKQTQGDKREREKQTQGDKRERMQCMHTCAVVLTSEC